jgi:hypothetical protein
MRKSLRKIVSGRAWKMERASVRRKGTSRPRSNKFSKSDAGRRPKAHTRKKIWVGGYKRRDGIKVKGYYRKNSGYKGRR